MACLALAIAGFATWNVSIGSKNNEMISNVMLANVEALANDEYGWGDNCNYGTLSDNDVGAWLKNCQNSWCGWDTFTSISGVGQCMIAK